MLEFQQDYPTHRAMQRGRLVSSARMGKIYVKAPTGTICDWHPCVGVQWKSTSLHEPSDQVPLYLQLRPGRPSGDKLARRIPSRVVRKPAFAENLAVITMDIPPSWHPFDKLKFLTDAMRYAADLTKERLSFHGPETPEEKVSWCFAVMRAMESFQFRLIRKARHAAPELR
eukprot:4192777-Pyramimonas_sp.AAC.1